MPWRKRAGEGDGVTGKGCSFMLVVREGLVAKVTSKSRPAVGAERAMLISGRRAFQAGGAMQKL